MHMEDDVAVLKTYFPRIISHVQNTIDKFKRKTNSNDDDILRTNSTLNNNINSFAINDDEDELLDCLKAEVESNFNKLLPLLTQKCSNSLNHFLHQYGYNQQIQRSSSFLAANNLHSFCHELKAILAACEAYPAAINGNLPIVKEFITNYPSFKDKPSLWGTTLLYSAVRHNHLAIVRYLLTQAQCSANAQNQQHQPSAGDFIPGPTALSTALHAACSNNNLELVQLLIEHDADYFIENQIHETAIQNGENRVKIKEFFQKFLILSYSLNLSTLPHKSILNEKQRVIDCIWEYKPFLHEDWYTLSVNDANELNQSLLQFNAEVHLKVQKDIYTVSMLTFSCNGIGQNLNLNLAWLRCLGSSILNFDIYSVWQIMLVEHPKAASVDPSLTIFNIPTSFHSTFEIQLNSWYNCDAKSSSFLENQMNMRRKQSTIDQIEYIGRDLIFNLQTFSFSNEEKTISGFVRWIPKLILYDQQNKDKITYIDNFESMADLNSIPLTTKHLACVQSKTNEIVTDGGDEPLGGNGDEEDDDDENEIPTLSWSDIWSLERPIADPAADIDMPDDSLPMDMFFDENAVRLLNLPPFQTMSASALVAQSQTENGHVHDATQKEQELQQQKANAKQTEQHFSQQLAANKEKQDRQDLELLKVQEQFEDSRENERHLQQRVARLQDQQLKAEQLNRHLSEQLKDSKEVQYCVELQKDIIQKEVDDAAEKQGQLEKIAEQLQKQQLQSEEEKQHLLQQLNESKKQKAQAEFEQMWIREELQNSTGDTTNIVLQNQELLNKLEDLQEQQKRAEQNEQQFLQLLEQNEQLTAQLTFEQFQVQDTTKKEQQLEILITELSDLHEQQKEAKQKEENCTELLEGNEQLKNELKRQQIIVQEQIQKSTDTERQLQETIKQLQEQLANVGQEEKSLSQQLAKTRKMKDQVEHELVKVRKHLEDSKENEQQVLMLLTQQQQNEKNPPDPSKIQTIDYNNLPIWLVQDFLVSRVNQITQSLKEIQSNDNFTPKLSVKETNYAVSLTGYQTHHNEFKLILQRFQILRNVILSANNYYQQHLNQISKKIKYFVQKVQAPRSYWQQYSKCFSELLQKKNNDYSELFNEYISKQSQTYIEQCISDPTNDFKPWIGLQQDTKRYMQKNPFTREIEKLKHQALNEFVKQTVLVQKLEKKPTQKSIDVLMDFIDTVKTLFETKEIYIGQEMKHFQLIPSLLQRIMIYYHCFLTQLPLYESAKELLSKIEENTVITISTATGSGKSTLLPSLLIAEGFDKVLVTQPRRLACNLLSQRVNSSIYSNISGWAVSGAEANVRAKILFLTDGLLKERLLYDENLITNETKLNKSIVFFIDEVHERSVNIDLCMALLARLLTKNPELKTKIKVIISSATLNTSVPKLYRNISSLKFDEFKLPAMGTLYPVKQFRRPNENVLDLVQELNKKLLLGDQILCFVNSTKDVHQNCQLLSYVSNGAIVAYPLVQAQSSKEQQSYINNGSIFFSTTVAETSLTFPSLKYVIDTGMINMPIYDVETKTTVLKEDRAAESTIKQRLGRLGRTKPGEYYALYDDKVEVEKVSDPANLSVRFD